MKTKKTLIDSWDQVPAFATEVEERAWWETHDLSDRMLASAASQERQRRARGEPGDRPADILARTRTSAS